MVEKNNDNSFERANTDEGRISFEKFPEDVTLEGLINMSSDSIARQKKNMKSASKGIGKLNHTPYIDRTNKPNPNYIGAMNEDLL
jgi:uncharacterized protein with von Willebrand factor type A (vWA) domain